MDKRTFVRLSQTKGSRILRPSVAQSARMHLIRAGVPDGAPSEGIFCIVRYHGNPGWKPFIYRFDELPGSDEVRGCEARLFAQCDLWEQFIHLILAANWCDVLGLNEPQLEEALLIHFNAFPHGRVTQVPGEAKFRILHGNDLTPFMGVSREAVEQLFSVKGNAHWVHDECEDCQADHRDAVRKILRLPEWETWRAV
jgi:hypothetical protein